ncbi:hypothetical protein J6590_046080 [Homalodisca vitripennis]|nr:hypothetical protein J6590_046080 [Homalodisca vitripennis]
MAGQAGCLQGQDRSAVTHPSSSHARRCLMRLSCDNRPACREGTARREAKKSERRADIGGVTPGPALRVHYLPVYIGTVMGPRVYRRLMEEVGRSLWSAMLSRLHQQTRLVVVGVESVRYGILSGRRFGKERFVV